eukprot:s70_g33.t1
MKLGGEEKEDEAVLQVVAEDSLVFDGEDPKIAKLLHRTLARVRGESNGFDEAEKEDLHAAFLRFKVPDSADIHKDDLDALLNFVGRWVPPEDAITEMARKITMYDYMDFDEFLTFMTYYDEFERAEQERIFKLYDQDSSGNISIAELRCLLLQSICNGYLELWWLLGVKGTFELVVEAVGLELGLRSGATWWLMEHHWLRKKAKAETATSRRLDSTSSSPLSLSAFDLAALLAPVTPEDFRRHVFEADALHVARPRCPGYYAPLEDLSSPQRLFKLMDDGIETPPPPSSIDEVKRLFSEGWSIQWLQPQHEHDALSAMVATLESQFGCLVGVNAYLTPGGAQGLAPHWDDVDVFVLQLGGSKAWTLHRHCTSSPLAPEQQTLPRYSSGDLDPETPGRGWGGWEYQPRAILRAPADMSLSEPFMRPKLSAGDLLLGIFRLDSSAPSVHLTISTFQRQTLYDLVQKTFEEAMSELWEEDETLRRALPWKALTLQAPQKEMSMAVAKQLRRLADAVEAESSGEGPGAVAGALGELGMEFVRHRMPPQVKQDEVRLVGLRDVVIVDTSAIALQPVPEDVDEDAARMLHCASNARKNHMMNHPPEATAQGQVEEAEEEAMEADEVLADPGQVLSGTVAKALRHLCNSEPKTLQELLKEAEIPESSWQEVCQVLTQLAAMGLAKVKEAPEAKALKPASKTKKRRIGAQKWGRHVADNMSGLGMLTLRQMMQEALAVVDKNWDGELNFEELCCFLAVYRGSEGFTKEEVESLKSLFDSEAVQEEEKPGRHDLPPEPKLPGKHLPSLLIQAFGMQVADNVEELQQQLASGQGFRKTATTDSGESGSATISFKEFLILARRTREMEMMQLSKEMPGLMNTPARGSSGDFASADSDGNGTISAAELYQFLIGKEFTPLKKVVQEILQEAAAEALERSEGLDFNQFFDFLFIYRQRDGFAKAEVDRFRRGFNEYDQDGSGSISTLELSDIFRDFGYRISVETLHHYIDRVDQDGSNQLDFREFLRLMRWHRESELDSYKAIFNNYKVTQDGSEGIPRKKLKAAIEVGGDINGYEYGTDMIEYAKEIDSFRALALLGYPPASQLLPAASCLCKELGAIGDLSIIDAEVEKLPKEMPPVDFDVYVHAVDASRLEYVRQEKKKAGFTDEELQRYTESFQKIDRDGSGSIEGKELLKLLEAFGWEPRSKHEREVLLERLNTARKRAREAEAPKVSADDSPEFGYWESSCQCWV